MQVVLYEQQSMWTLIKQFGICRCTIVDQDQETLNRRVHVMRMAYHVCLLCQVHVYTNACFVIGSAVEPIISLASMHMSQLLILLFSDWKHRNNTIKLEHNYHKLFPSTKGRRHALSPLSPDFRLSEIM